MTVRPAIVGGFVLGAIALAAVGVILFGGSRLFARTVRAVIFFEGSVAGLDVGAPVTFRGVRLGAVTRVELNFNPATRVASIPVTIEVEPDRIIWQGAPAGAADISRLDEEGLRAQLASQSLVTGQLRVDLDFRPDTPMRLVGGRDLPEIPAIPSELDQIRSKLVDLPLRELVDTAQHTLVSIDSLAGQLSAQVHPVANSIGGAANAATTALKTVDDTIVGLRGDLDISLRNVDALLADARRQLDGRGGDLSRFLAGIDRSLRSVDVLVASASSFIAPRSNARGDLEATLRDLSVAASSLRTFAHTVERDPSAVLTGRTGR